MKLNLKITTYIIILAVITIIAAICGYMGECYGYSFWDSIYKTLQLFTLGNSSIPEESMIINVARFLAPCLTIFGGVQLIYSVSQDGLKRICLTTYKKHVVVCGYGFTGKKIVNKLLENKQRVIVVDPCVDESKFSLTESYIKGDATDMNVLLEARVNKASKIIIATGEDYINTLIYNKVQKIASSRQQKKYLRIEKLEDKESLGNGADSITNFSELITKDLKVRDNSNIVVLGLGSIGGRIVERYCSDHNIMVFEQSETMIKVTEERISAPNVCFIKADVKGLLLKDLMDCLNRYDFDTASHPLDVFVCLGGDWLGFTIAWNWSSWKLMNGEKKISMKINLIGNNIDKELFSNVKNLGHSNEVVIYNIVDDILQQGKWEGLIQ